MSLNISGYLAERDALIVQDRSLRRDHARASKYSEAELKADKLVRAVRAHDASTIWAAPHEDVPHPFPGMEFLTGRKIIEQTKLFEIVRKMPKGALLHAHLDGTVDPRITLKNAYKQPAMHVRVLKTLHRTSLADVTPEFRPFPESSWKPGSLTEPHYVPGTWVQLHTARDGFSAALGGPEGFDNWAFAALSIDPSEAYGTHNSVEKIWKKFENAIDTMTGLVRYAPMWAENIRECLRAAVAEGISYIEGRVNFDRYMFQKDAVGHLPHREWLLIVRRVVNEVKEELKAQDKDEEFIGTRIIYTSIKFLTPEELLWHLDDCIGLKKEFPDIIAGFDLVGPEHGCKPLIDYAPVLLHFRVKTDELGLDIPFLFHAGETLGGGNAADMNLYDAILLGSRRIGHAFSILKHPKLMDLCKEKGIVVEACPISNEVLRLTSSMEMHPLPAMLNHGFAVAICSDDPALWGTMGVSYDFYQVLAASELTGLLQLGEIARDSISYSTLEDATKAHALHCFEKQWAVFIDQINRTA